MRSVCSVTSGEEIFSEVRDVEVLLIIEFSGNPFEKVALNEVF